MINGRLTIIIMSFRRFAAKLSILWWLSLPKIQLQWRLIPLILIFMKSCIIVLSPSKIIWHTVRPWMMICGDLIILFTHEWAKCASSVCWCYFERSLNHIKFLGLLSATFVDYWRHHSLNVWSLFIGHILRCELVAEWLLV